MKKVCILSECLLILICFFSSLTAFAAPADPAAKPIKIGIIGPMDMRSGNHLFITAQMSVEKINASGGVRVGSTKRPIELIKITSNEFRKIPDAISAAERAVTVDKVDFLIGGIVPEAVAVMQDIAADNKVLYFSNSYLITKEYVERMAKGYNRYKYCFTSASLYTSDIIKTHVGIVAVTAKAVRQAGIAKPRVALMVEKTVAGDAIFNFMSKTLKEMGMEISGGWRPSPTASDLRAETAAIKSSNPHIIYTVFSGSGGVVFGRQVQELKIPALVAGSPGASVHPGELIPYSVSMQSSAAVPVKITEKNLSFMKEFRNRSGGEINVNSSYGVINALVHCIEKIGSLNQDALIKALETEEVYGISGPYKFDAKDHRTVYLKGFRPVYGLQAFPDGQAAVVWPTDSPVKAQPVQIPQWMIEAWKTSR